MNYYTEEINKTNALGTKGKLIQEFVQLMKILWNPSDPVFNPIEFKLVFDEFCSFFEAGI